MFFKNFFIVKTAATHRYVVLITNTNEMILVDGWDSNLICNFNAEDLIKYGRLDCLYGIEIDCESMKDARFGYEYYSTYSDKNCEIRNIVKSDLDKIWNKMDGLIEQNMDKKNLLLNRMEDIDFSIGNDSKIRKAIKLKCEKKLENALEMVSDKKDKCFLAKIDYVFHLIDELNQNVQPNEMILLNSKILKKVFEKMGGTDKNLTEMNGNVSYFKSKNFPEEIIEMIRSVEINKAIYESILNAINLKNIGLNVNVDNLFQNSNNRSK